jgi:riboflavin synthase
MGTVAARDDLEGDARLDVEVPETMFGCLRVGDSVAVNGVCLTVTEARDNHVFFDVSAETLSATCLGTAEAGTPLNLEPALSASDPVGGHFVTGHVDGVGEIVSVEADGRSRRVEVEAPDTLARYIAPKGCITVDGVSLTVNEVNGSRFGFNLIPHTLSSTNMQYYAAGTRVHLEIDIIARYLERLVEGRGAESEEDNITADFLTQQGFAPPVMDEDEEGQEDAPEDGLDEPGPA